jgi:hypothetical protein
MKGLMMKLFRKIHCSKRSIAMIAGVGLAVTLFQGLGLAEPPAVRNLPIIQPTAIPQEPISDIEQKIPTTDVGRPFTIVHSEIVPEGWHHVHGIPQNADNEPIDILSCDEKVVSIRKHGRYDPAVYVKYYFRVLNRTDTAYSSVIIRTADSMQDIHTPEGMSLGNFGYGPLYGLKPREMRDVVSNDIGVPYNVNSMYCTIVHATTQSGKEIIFPEEFSSGLMLK